MFWSKRPDKPDDASKQSGDASKKPDASHAATTNIDPRKDATDFNPDKLPDRRDLPKGMQNIMDKADKDDNFFDELVEG